MKVSGSTASLVRGVSQQVPQDRQPGQHGEQINLLPDPVQGLARRPGSRWQGEKQTTLLPADWAALVADTDNYRSFDYSNGGVDYTLLYRTAARAAGSTLPLFVIYNRTAKTFLDYSRNVTDAQLDLLESGGISAITSVGKYVFLAGHSIVPTATSDNVWASPANANDSVVWVRGGAYSRTFKVTATRDDNVPFSFEYTTPTSSYPGTLDTSGVPLYAADPAGGTTSDTEGAYIKDVAGVPTAELGWAQWDPTGLTAVKGTAPMTNVHPAAPTTNLEFAWAPGAGVVTFHSSNLNAVDVTMTYTHTKTITNPAYAGMVQDIVNAYNSAVTAWIGTAAAAIQPEAIAEQLKLAAIAAGLVGATRQQSTLIFTNVKSLSVSDGGDGSLVRGVANEVTGIEQVSDIHKIGKVIRVRARNSAESFYLKAISQDAAITSGYAEVTWVEGAGTVHTITNALLRGVVNGGQFCVASSSALLAVIAPGPHPEYAPSSVGDADSSPLPFFVGRKISYLGVFQDRLLIGAGATIRASRTGDYLTFFRTSVLTIPADDPLEMLSQGSEDDVMRFSELYDRDLVLFAEKRQYVISGRQPLTPTSANMPVMSSHSDAALAPPLAAGGIIFYGKSGEDSSSVHQVQPGINPESPDSFVVSSQVDTYLSGTIIELSKNAKPTHLFMRLTGARESVFVFSYLDKEGQGRAQDAWGRFDFNPALGVVVGMSPSSAGLLVFFLRKAVDAGGIERVYTVTDLVPLTANLSRYPYLDSLRPYSAVLADTGSVHADTTGPWFTAFDTSSEYQFVGDTLENSPDLITSFPLATGPWTGAEYTSMFVPTNPFIRDRNDKAITSGLLTITKLITSWAKSSGFWADITARQTTVSQEYNARIVGQPDDIVGREVVTDFSQSVPIGHETRNYRIALRARKWLPFTLISLEWAGQFFNRTQRL